MEWFRMKVKGNRKGGTARGGDILRDRLLLESPPFRSKSRGDSTIQLEREKGETS